MSQAGSSGLDPASHGPDHLVDLTTDGVSAARRLTFWRDAVLRRMEPSATSETGGPLLARLRRIVDYSQPIEVERSRHAAVGLIMA